MVAIYLISIAALLPCLLCQQILDDPLCQNKVCPTGQICRHYKPCGEQENCNVTSICTETKANRGGCLFGDPVLTNTTLDDLSCYTKAPCPGNAYCSTELQDIGAVCCLSNPVKIVRPGVCPRFQPDPNSFWCVDGCRSDGDCRSDYKCCNTGCSNECVYIETVNTPPTIDLFQTPPPPPALPTNRDPCEGKVCPSGQSCRHYKPCGEKDTCGVTGVCTAIQPTRGGCKFGSPLLYNNNGRQEELTCHTKAPCPEDAYCSTRLQDVAAVCCLSDPAPVMRSDVICPVPVKDPSRFWCVDGCKSDGDCFSAEKCCYTGCSKECIPAGTPPPPALLPSPSNPCDGKTCPAGQVCRHYKACGQYGKCDVTSICTDLTSYNNGCQHGAPILFTKNGILSKLSCWRDAPCPGNAYCSTELMDTSSSCCLTDPTPTQKPGYCPAQVRQTNPLFCYDQCKSDGDCGWDDKCCNTGCKLECVRPTYSRPSALIPPLPWRQPNSQRDPCDNKLCPANMYCRRRGQPCRHQWSCGPEGSCIRCPFVHHSPGFRFGTDPDGCPVVMTNGRPIFGTNAGRPGGPLRISPLNYLLLNELFNKK